MTRIAITTPELAEVLHLTARSVDRMVAAGILPRPAGGKHDALAAVRAYLGHIRHDGDGRAARAEQARAQAQRQRIAARRMVGELLTIAEQRDMAGRLFEHYWKAIARASSFAFAEVSGALPELSESQRRVIVDTLDAHLKSWTRAARDAVADDLARLPAALKADARIDAILRSIDAEGLRTVPAKAKRPRDA